MSKKTARLNIRVEAALRAELERLASASGRPLSNYVHYLLRIAANNEAAAPATGNKVIGRPKPVRNGHTRQPSRAAK